MARTRTTAQLWQRPRLRLRLPLPQQAARAALMAVARAASPAPPELLARMRLLSLRRQRYRRIIGASRIDQLDDRHGPDKEKQDPCGLGKKMAKLTVDEEVEFRIQPTLGLCPPVLCMPILEGFGRHQRRVIDRIERPAQNSGQNR
jgi:hypothetical protein